MNRHVVDYFTQFSDEKPSGRFHRVIALHDSPDLSWESIKEKTSTLCKGWYELAQLTQEDRVLFCCEYWISKLPFRPHVDEFIQQFFSLVEDVGIFVTQRAFDDAPTAQMVYSLRNEGGFYRGGAPATEDEIIALQEFFSGRILPVDYVAFLEIHNGFRKATDNTGLIRVLEIPETYECLQEHLSERRVPLTFRGEPVNYNSLIPFYKSFGMPFFQCFISDWYPENEMGNVYYSGVTDTISNPKGGDSGLESMAFPTFLDWLQFYTEQVH